MSSNTINSLGAGYYGKIPVLGDFLNEELATTFTDSWNEWLRAALAVSKEQLGDQWLENYLVSPVWHFALSEGCCGPDSYIGTMIPNVDKVGRHYPFMLAKPTKQNPFRCREESQWCADFEEWLLMTLDDNFDFQTWRSDIKKHEFSVPTGKLISLQRENTRESNQNSVVKGALNKDSTSYLHLNHRDQYGEYSLWWTDGSEDIEAVSIVCKGMPLISQYSSMLDGKWEDRGWHVSSFTELAESPV